MSTVRDLALELRTNLDLRREAFSMSLYVSIVLLSALEVFDDQNPPGHGEVFLVELGATIGLVLAHGFASWISTGLSAARSDGLNAWDLLRVQLGGAMVIAVMAMLAVIVAPSTYELQAARLTVTAAIAGLVYFESRAVNGPGRALLHGALALVAGALVATLKAVLTH